MNSEFGLALVLLVRQPQPAKDTRFTKSRKTSATSQKSSLPLIAHIFVSVEKSRAPQIGFLKTVRLEKRKVSDFFSFFVKAASSSPQ